MTDLPLLRFPGLARFPGLEHAVSTRLGGVSVGPFASLNLSTSVGDDRANVEVNTQRLAAALGVPREHFTTTWLVHSNRVVRADASHRGQMVAQADGVITDVPGLPLIQRYGDCAPILVYDPRRHAVGLAHAGWRGTVVGMATALVEAMAAAFGSDPADMAALVGPAIGPCCYEVGPEVAEAVRRAMPDAPHVLIQPAQVARGAAASNGHRPHLDLWEANRWQLAQAGVGQVEVAGLCTCCRRDLFFSHRGDGGRTGRFGAIAMLRR
ncbi:MAG: peptidoglycan editing factor PgeF [Caldilineales bacterium]|nr:peptidoglycan editing factor PgeF [Caldilineales bacterium]MDW8316242.1 peptidoglycan editing factor PgeF [Anaerolineae bacterium]